MSREYYATVDVEEIAEGKLYDVEGALEEAMGFSGGGRYYRGKNSTCVSEITSLGGGRSEETAADELAIAVWKANGKPCPVRLSMVYLESPDTHDRGVADVDRLGGDAIFLQGEDNEAD